MKRRPFLHSLAAAGVLGAGCLGATDAPPDSALASDARTTDGSTAGTSDPAGSDAAMTVESVETFEYVIRLNDLGSDPGGGVTAYSDLKSRERAVVDAALDGGYETDNPPEWLTRFAGGTPMVRRDGAYYRLNHTLPTTTIEAKAVGESAVSGAVATYEEYEAAVTHDGVVSSGLLRIAQKGGVDLTYVWPALRKFLDAYDAVKYHGEVVDFSVTVEDAGAPYTVSAAEISTSEAVGGSVWNASNASAETRRLVRAAGNASGTYGFGDAPAGFIENLDAHEYVYLDGTFYTAYVEKRESLPVSVSAAFADATTASGGELRLALRNDGDSEVRITCGAPKPFGVLHFRPKGDTDGKQRRLLWTDAYEESQYVNTDGREVTSILDIGLATKLGPGEEATRTFELPADLPSGEYVVEDSLGVDAENGGTLRYRVTFRVS
ncbi:MULTISPECIES: hypothetical protein [Halorussus]|uniref:hypothetical protein n=1 Tax=Halorussus TaxID=1070314 RepID=UPI0020A1D436|nr:hypothetical protein [Halorussus vallis]USZ76411.1 hypothetical protein NGM07_03565 [Halorussus vallis]